MDQTNCQKSVKYSVKRNKLELTVPRKFLGLENKKNFTLDFHWADNIQIFLILLNLHKAATALQTDVLSIITFLNEK